MVMHSSSVYLAASILAEGLDGNSGSNSMDTISDEEKRLLCVVSSRCRFDACGAFVIKTTYTDWCLPVHHLWVVSHLYLCMWGRNIAF